MKKKRKKKSETQEEWLSANRAAIAAYNRRVRLRGVFSDEWRRF